MDNSQARRKRLTELEDLVARRDKLSDQEYLDLLHEIRKNYTVKLAMLSVRLDNRETGGTVNVIDKVHWLIDNMETKHIEKQDGDDHVVHVHFTPYEPDDKKG